MSKRATKAAPSPDSMRSVRRKNRGFVSLEVSSRIHRRALRRLNASRFVYGQSHPSGTKVGGGTAGFVHTAGGSIKYR